MQKLVRLVAAGALVLLLGMSLSQAQEVTYSAGPPTGAQNLQGLGFSWADINQNGTLDLFIEPDNLILNNGNTFTRAVSSGVVFNVATVGSILADFNGDGYPDALVTQGGARPLLYQFNSVTGQFVDVSGSSGDLATITPGTTGQMYGLAAGDYNRDGYLDLVWAGAANQAGGTSQGTGGPDGRLRLLRGGASGFTSVGTTAASPVIDTLKFFESWNPRFVDVNNDGYPDLFLPSLRNGLNTNGSRSVLFLNNGNGTFSPPAPGLYTGPADTGLVVGDTVRHYSAIASAWGDFNNDGIQDLAISALGGEEKGSGFRLLRGNGNGTFTDVTPATGISYNSGTRGLSWGDYNNDGWLDLFEAAGFAPPKFWRNNGNGTFTNVSAVLGLPASGINSRCGQLIDYDGDGFLDFYTAAGGGDYLWHNGGNLNNWIAFKPVGAGHNMSAIGARFAVYTNGGTTMQVREIESGGSGGATGGSVWANFGVGVATTVDSVVVRWPDGSKQTFTGLAVNKYWTINEGSVVPAVPVLAGPPNGATGLGTTDTLSWSAAAGATGYRVQVSLDPAFVDPGKLALNATTTGTSRIVTLGLGSTYYWRVLATNGGFTSAYSAANNFATLATAATQVPVLLAPTSGAVNQPAIITLTVGRTSDAAQYHWQVSTLPTFAGFSINDLTVDTSRTATLVSGRKYYWKVRGENGLGSSAFSAVDSFTVTTAPATPALVFPANNAVNVRADTLVLAWRSVAGAANYVLELSRSSATGLVVNEFTTTDTTLQVRGLLRLTTYYYRVRGVNAGGSSLFSGANGFTTLIAAPGAPTLLLPAANAVNVNRGTKFWWNPSVSATKYRVQVASDNAFTTIVKDTIRFEDTTLTVTPPLTALSDYFWRVSALNLGGESAFSASRLFTTGTLVAVKEPEALIPTAFGLAQNYPNPFNPSTTITYDVPEIAHVSIVIYDVLGREVAKLVDATQGANRYTVQWNAVGVSTGVYFYRMEAQKADGTGNFNSVKKLLLMK